MAAPLTRRLRLEPLEDRRLLSITVNTLLDQADGSILDGSISLRDAIAAAQPGETIDFSVTGTIELTKGATSATKHLTINKDLTINGPGSALLTIDASGNDFTPGVQIGDGTRVFRIDDGTSTRDRCERDRRDGIDLREDIATRGERAG